MDDHAIDDHDRGLQHDLQVMATREIARRRMLGWLATGGSAALLAACGGGDSSEAASSTSASTASSSTSTSTTTSTATSTTASSGSCVADPTETNGPYPSDGSNSVNGSISNVLTQSGVVRSDITTSFGSYSGTAAGVPLTLTITLADANSGCAPLAGYAIYIWHCTRDGLYSLYTVADQNYLRGVQVTDANGQATFTTIFPGCYDGRWPHIHFEVYPSLERATGYANRALVSQFALPSAACSEVYNGASGYAASISNFANISIARDNVFGDNTAAQIAAQTPAISGGVASGYAATVTVGLAV